MASVIGLVIGSSLVFISRRYNGRVKYLKSATEFNPNVDGASYIYIKPDMFNMIKFNDFNLLSKETQVKKIRFDTSISPAGSSFLASDMYQNISMNKLYANTKDPNLRFYWILRLLHNKFNIKICTSLPYETPDSKMMCASVINKGKCIDEVYGVVDDGSEYIAVFDYYNDSFVINSNLAIEKDKKIEELIDDTKLDGHTYYNLGVGLLVLSLFCGLIEAYLYYG